MNGQRAPNAKPTPLPSLSEYLALSDEPSDKGLANRGEIAHAGGLEEVPGNVERTHD
jgi:hypothetical protein